MPKTDWVADLLPGFEQTTLHGLMAPDGPANPVLVRRRCNQASGRAVLYVHGYVDYFFQTHLADFYNQQGLHFYAIDLRRHGRALRPGQRPNYTGNLDEFVQDLDRAIECLQQSEQIDWLLLNGHSTGGLVAALHAQRGQMKSAVQALFLNSPFLDMNLPPWQAHVLEPVLAAVGGWWPGLVIAAPPSVYGRSLHADHCGQWRYNTDWKPIDGFSVFAGWLRAIHRAQQEVAHGLAIACPILLLHAQRSAWPTQCNADAMSADIVLNVADMQRLAPRLGPQVEVLAIADGIHDLVLSGHAARQRVFVALQDWLQRIGAVAARSVATQ